MTNSIVVEDAYVDGDRLLHEEGNGFKVAMATLDGGRIGIAAQALGIARAAFEEARAYAQERKQPSASAIADFQAIQFSWPTWRPRSTRRACSLPRGVR